MTHAGILVTGTEVLTGAVTDRNGPWLARRLEDIGFEVAHICTVRDNPRQMQAALSMMAAQGSRLIVTSGGLGPTADDLTVETVADWLQVPLVTDPALEGRIAKIVSSLRLRKGIEAQAMREGNRKQATIPAGGDVLEPVGTAPGLVLDATPRQARGAGHEQARADTSTPQAPHARGGPADARGEPGDQLAAVVILPGPPRELQPMWETALQTELMRRIVAEIAPHEVRTMRLFGVPESQLAQTLRRAHAAGVEIDALEVTTCQHRGELEITTRVPEGAKQAYAELESFLAERHGEELFSRDERGIDDLVAAALGRRLALAVAESCTGGLLTARLTDLPGSSAYVKGSIVVYSNAAKVSEAGVAPALIERHGAVSAEVAEALAQGARKALEADVGVGITGIAGPGGGSEDKPVGLVWLAVAGPDEARLIRSVRLPGNRAEVRERAVTVAMHLILRAVEDANGRSS